MFLTEQALGMPKESRKFIPVQQFIGLQVIDTKGSLIGNVKDVSIDVESKNISFKVATKSKGEMAFGWDDVQSVEDVVLLKKQIDTPPTQAESTPESSGDQLLQALVICPSCGAEPTGFHVGTPKLSNKVATTSFEIWAASTALTSRGVGVLAAINYTS